MSKEFLGGIAFVNATRGHRPIESMVNDRRGRHCPSRVNRYFDTSRRVGKPTGVNFAECFTTFLADIGRFVAFQANLDPEPPFAGDFPGAHH